MKDNPIVSVIIPFYGSFDRLRAELSVKSISAQSLKEKEIVIAEQNESPSLEDFANIYGLKYVYQYHCPRKDLSDFSPGRVRNLAAKVTEGRFVYTNDGDILFKNPLYLTTLVNLLDKEPDLALYRPPMRRLPLDCFEIFLENARNMGIAAAVSSLNLEQEYLALTDNNHIDIKVVRRNKGGVVKVVTANMDDFQRYVHDPSLKGSEPTIWTHDIHCGGNFMRKSQFETVGGYCEDFVNWGCEDSDLQWKLAGLLNLRSIPKDPKFEVIHIDHPKGYFSKEMWKRNEAIHADRKTTGLAESVKKDKEAYKNGQS